MLSAATSATIRTAEGRGAPAVLPFGPDRPSMTPVSVGHGAMWHVGHASTLTKGRVWCHSATKHGWTALLSGEYRLSTSHIPYSVGGAPPTIPKGHDRCHPVIEHEWGALASGECRAKSRSCPRAVGRPGGSRPSSADRVATRRKSCSPRSHVVPSFWR